MLFMTEKEMIEFYQKTNEKIAELLRDLIEIENDEEVNYKIIQQGKEKIKDVKTMLNEIIKSHSSKESVNWMNHPDPNFNPLLFNYFCGLIEAYFRKYERLILQYDDFIADVTSEAWLIMEKTPFKDIPELYIWLRTNISRINIENNWGFVLC